MFVYRVIMYITTSSIYLRWARSLAVATAIRVLNSTRPCKRSTFTEVNSVQDNLGDKITEISVVYRGLIF